MKKLAFLLLLASATGNSQTVGQHWMWTASGPRWSTFSGSSFNGGAITGDLLIQKTSPLLTIEATNNTASQLTLKRTGVSYPTVWSMYIPATTTDLAFYNGATLLNLSTTNIFSYLPFYVKHASGLYVEDAATTRQIQIIPPTISTTGIIQTNSTANGLLLKSSAGGNQLFLADDGNVGIGDVSPLYDLTVGSGDVSGFDAGDIYIGSRIYIKSASAWTGAAYGVIGMNAGANKKFAIYDYNLSRSPFEIDMATQTITMPGPITIIRALSYTWPSTQGAVGSTLTNDGAGVFTWGNANSGAGKYYEIYDEFVSYNGGGQSGAISYIGGTGAAVGQDYASVTADSNRWGKISLTTGSVAASGAGIGWGSDNLTIGAGATYFECDVKVSRRFPAGGTNAHAAGVHAGDDWMVYIGFGDNLSVTGTTYSATAPTDGLFFFAHTDSNGTATSGPSSNWKWSIVGARNNARLHKWTGVAVDTINFQKLAISSPTAAGPVTFYINGTSVGTISEWANIPTTPARATGVNLKFNKVTAQATTPTVNKVVIDRVYVRKDYYPVR